MRIQEEFLLQRIEMALMGIVFPILMDTANVKIEVHEQSGETVGDHQR